MKPEHFADFANEILAGFPARFNVSGDPAETLSGKADRLGLIKAQIAALQDDAEKLRADLEAAGLPSIEGNLYRVRFAQCAGRPITDWAGIAQRLNPSRQLIAAHTTTSKESTSMRVTARTIKH
jgi:hypothetical protein